MLIAQVDFSHVRVINKETLFNKRNELLLFLHRSILHLAWHGIQARPSRVRLRNLSHRGEFVAEHFCVEDVLLHLNG